MERALADLRHAYRSAAEGQKSCMICLESIRHARTIIDGDLSIRQILEIAEIPLSYRQVVSTGLNLSKYVEIKAEFK